MEVLFNGKYQCCTICKIDDLILKITCNINNNVIKLGQTRYRGIYWGIYCNVGGI